MTLSLESTTKLQIAYNDLRKLERTGNPQYAYHAIQVLMWITKIESDSWNPDIDQQTFNENESKEVNNELQCSNRF